MNHEHKINNEQLKRLEKSADSIAQALKGIQQVLEAQNRQLAKLGEQIQEGKNGTP